MSQTFNCILSHVKVLLQVGYVVSHCEWEYLKAAASALGVENSCSEQEQIGIRRRRNQALN